MPKRSRTASSSRGSKRAKSYGRKRTRVPRSVVINGESVHRHHVCCSSSVGTKLLLNYPASGVAEFNNGVAASPNLSLQFSLGSVDCFIGGAGGFSIAIPGAAQLAALYDTYQIEKVEYRMYIGSSTSQAGVNDTGIAGTANSLYEFPLPIIGWTPDTDDADNTSLTDLQQYSTYKQKQVMAGEPLTGSLIPAVAGGVWNGAIRSGYTRLVKQDVNCANPGVPHYGVKMCVDGMRASPNTTATLVSFFFKLHFVMKQAR